MATITLTNDLQNGTTADADEVMENLEDIQNECNGSLDADNVDFAVAPAIGGTTPAAGAFTTLSSSGATTVSSLIIGSGTYNKTRYINLTPSGAITPASNGAALAQTDGTYFSYWTLAFDKDTDENAFWIFDVPAEYDAGNVTVTIKAKSTATTGDVVWSIKTASVADAATFDATLGNANDFTAKTVDGTAGDIFEQSKTFDPGWTAGDLAVLHLYRDVSADDAAADILFIMLVVEWEVA